MPMLMLGLIPVMIVKQPTAVLATVMGLALVPYTPAVKRELVEIVIIVTTVIPLVTWLQQEMTRTVTVQQLIVTPETVMVPVPAAYTPVVKKVPVVPAITVTMVTLIVT